MNHILFLSSRNPYRLIRLAFALLLVGSIISFGQQPGGAPTPQRPTPEPANPNLPTLFLIGDSTVRNGSGDGANKQWGWGEPLAAYFDATKINVVNRAIGGRSSRTFLTEGRWDQVVSKLKPGDVVIMQFGHNDGGAINDTSRARGTIPGTGEETEEVDNLITNKHEVVHTYGWYLRKYIVDAKAKGATPIVCSPVPRKIWKDGKVVRDKYARWAEEVAKKAGVAFIDLNEITARKYEVMGPEKVEPLFADEHTHTSWGGAEINAASVIEGLKSLKPNPLAAYFSAKASALKAAEITSARAPSILLRAGESVTSATVVTPTNVSSPETGNGYEPGADLFGNKPFSFSVALPEGNSHVKVTFGERGQSDEHDGQSRVAPLDR